MVDEMTVSDGRAQLPLHPFGVLLPQKGEEKIALKQ